MNNLNGSTNLTPASEPAVPEFLDRKLHPELTPPKQAGAPSKGESTKLSADPVISKAQQAHKSATKTKGGKLPVPPPKSSATVLKVGDKVPEPKKPDAKKPDAMNVAIAQSGARSNVKATDEKAKPLSGTLQAKADKAKKLLDAAQAKAAKKAASATKAAAKTKTGDRARYDWSGAREKAAKGTIPPTPDFSANTHRSYRGLLGEVEALVKAKDLAGLQAYRVKGTCSSPQAVKKYREIAIIALKAKAA